MAYRIIAGYDIGCGRYASISGRNGNIRGVIFKNIYAIMRRGFGTSSIDRQSRNKLLYAACNMWYNVNIRLH